jgi:hypothetical protein
MSREAPLLSMIREYCGKAGIRCVRNHVGAYRRGRSWIAYGEKGQADLTLRFPGRMRPVHVETKGDGVVSDDQRAWQEDQALLGNETWNIRSFDAFLEKIRRKP